MSVLLALALGQTIVPTADLPSASEDPCTAFPVRTSQPKSRPSVWTTDELVGITDIGAPVGTPNQSVFDVSPDGRQIAFIVHRANPAANAYCLKLLVAPITGEGPAIEVARDVLAGGASW